MVRGESWERERKTASASVKKERLMKKERERDSRRSALATLMVAEASVCFSLLAAVTHTFQVKVNVERAIRSFSLLTSLHLLTVVRTADRQTERDLKADR